MQPADRRHHVQIGGKNGLSAHRHQPYSELIPPPLVAITNSLPLEYPWHVRPVLEYKLWIYKLHRLSQWDLTASPSTIARVRKVRFYSRRQVKTDEAA
jgi:hypothetical protein